MENIFGSSADDEGYVMFVGLNPSTADETKDDPTIRRCRAFAKSWHYPAMCMTNLFAYRATDPDEMITAKDAVGVDNDTHLLNIARGASLIVCAWGCLGEFENRDTYVKALLTRDGKQIYCIQKTQGGHPAHPLYLPKYLKPVPLC